ncbi:MAG: hypothetical protein ABJF23_25330 [Bryobacteraceae bacterium]
MILLALFAVLADGVISVPASHWSAVDVSVSKPNSVVDTTFSVPSGATGVEAILVTRHEAERYNAGRSYQPICRSGYQTEGRLRCEAEQKGDYILLIDNRLEGRKPAEVSVRINVRLPASVIAITVPPAKRAVIIALSLLFFVAVVMFSARQLMR